MVWHGMAAFVSFGSALEGLFFHLRFLFVFRNRSFFYLVGMAATGGLRRRSSWTQGEKDIHGVIISGRDRLDIIIYTPPDVTVE